MNDFHKDMLKDVIKDWSVEQVEDYINELEERASDLSEWIRLLKMIRRKKIRKPVYDNGPRGGI